MTVIDLIKSSTLPRPEINLLVAFILQKEISFLLTHPETKIHQNIYLKFKRLEEKRKEGFSIAALSGEKEFYGLKFKVNKNVLIPRPETEMIVDIILEKYQKIKTKNKYALIDIGTGSGAIILACASNLKKENPDSFKETDFLALDISRPALKIAKENAIRQKMAKKIKFFQGNLLAPLKNQPQDKDLIICANLPYLTKKQISTAPSIQKEPILALDGGKDGLKYYIELFRQLKISGYKSLFLVCEIDPTQAIKISKAAKLISNTIKTTIKKDYNKKNRFIIFEDSLI